MAIEKFTKDMNIISKLDDEPNDVGGMTAAELKASFDEGGLAVKEYMNTVLVPAIDSGNDNTTGLAGRVTAVEGRATDVENRVTTAESDIDGLETTVQEHGTAIAKNADDITYFRGAVDGNTGRIRTLANELVKPEHTTLTVHVTGTPGAYTGDNPPSICLAHSGDGVVKAEMYDESEAKRSSYNMVTATDSVAVFARTYKDGDITMLDMLTLNADQSVVRETVKLSTVTSAFAVCYDEAAPSAATPNTWYIPKTMPRPSGEVGMMLDVFWANGRVNGLGYDIKLIYGEPGGADNEVIIETANVSSDLTGRYNIPTEGTVRYQLTEQSGRKRWKYVSGDVIPAEFSCAAAADAADKPIPGMTIGYVPGMEIYVQMDRGNAADTMRLVPEEGTPLPVYGNGIGAKTGTIPASYILHLKNAGDHWQIINGGSGGGGGVTDHADLTGRNKADQHPMRAITGLTDALADKQPTGDYALKSEVPSVPAWAMAPAKPTYTASEVGARPSTWTPTASDVGAVPISGGTMTGNLEANYITANWLQTKAATKKNNLKKIAVIDDQGWIYYMDKLELTSHGITGAKVGDTIKVKAVDASGKPTAWEAVGEDKWELIDTFTSTAENKGVFRISQEPDGTPYKFKAVLVDMTGPANGNSISLFCYSSEAGRDFEHYGAYASTDVPSQWGANGTTYMLYQDRGFWRGAQAMAGTSSGMYENTWQKLGSPVNKFQVLPNEHITTVRQWKELAPGFTFKIWAVRA